MLLTASGLLVLSSAEPLSRVSAMHVLLGGMLGAGLAHVGVMLAIAAVPGAVVALPWVAALSAYRLGICEALTMLVAGYVYTVAMALALLYLYTQHFSYVQAVYLFVMFHAALAGALRAEPSRSITPGEAPVPPPQVAAILAEGSAGPPEQSWVSMWVPGRGVVLQRTVYFALLACGGAMFAGTTNIWLHAAILRAHSSHDLPLWLALFVASAPVLVLVGLEIHCKLLSAILGTVISLPRGVLAEGVDLLRFVRRRLGYYVPGEARGGGSRYHLRPVRRVFYSHVLRDQEPGAKWGPERDLWLLRNALRRIGYWLAGVKPPVTGRSLSHRRKWAGRGLPSSSECSENEVSGDASSDPTWSPSFEGSAVGYSAAVAAAADDDDGQEASSAFRELPRGSERAGETAGKTNALRESGSEGHSGRRTESEAANGGLLGFLRAGSEPRSPSERGDHPRFALLARRLEGGADAGTEEGAERYEASRSESDAPGWGARFWGGVTCRDDREFDQNVNEERGETGALSGAGEEWDWLAAEGLTPGEALAGQSCPVCLSLRKNLAFGCGHQTCQSCGAGLAKCPICRKRISVRVHLFH
ncbi:RING/U-box superfamily protein [Klebsormidium nitens]|uniref:RING/U-box superfamily protein n=1 Tax=Klebsormidium nitens TaxID=105231 RepID=A0A1Y1HUQ8_KLENI|nr:RING/U-box superfamily protein [Klebsormidium nitens]|eukprot:GAQ79588.1 RING/U-box superfamily protein [Klebsormidium nitens]